MIGRFSRILVVDDSAVARKIVTSYLNSYGYENIDEASDGREALAMLDKRYYALVVSDWDMAPMNGIQLLQAMRAKPHLKFVPFIMATAFQQRKFAEIARDRGATHFLTKPYSAEALASRIASLDEAIVA